MGAPSEQQAIGLKGQNLRREKQTKKSIKRKRLEEQNLHQGRD